jgi:hypothetical protein
MTSRTFGACVIAVLLLRTFAAGQTPGALGSIPQTPPRTPPQPSGLPPARDTAQKTGTAIIRGRVVGADDGQGLRRAQVRLAGGELRESRGAVMNMPKGEIWMHRCRPLSLGPDEPIR